MKRIGVIALCLALLALSAPPAFAQDEKDPLFVFYDSAVREGLPKGNGFEGPCGLAVDLIDNFYVADYYNHAVKAFDSGRNRVARLGDVDPLDGPCGLAVGVGPAAGTLYVNDFHRGVVSYTPSSFPFLSPEPYGAGTTIDSAESTGVAVDPASGNVYVDDRTYVAVYEPSGAPVEVGGEPLRIGLGSLEDGYGVAISTYPGSSGTPSTAGYVYVPDAATGTVKVYDPATDAENPLEEKEIDGNETPEGGFVSLRDATIAVDQSNGLVYVADNLQPEYHEHPEAAIYAFKADGIYAGRLKYNIFDALPPGLAIGGGRVYVTSGNTNEASVLAYTAGALTKAVNPALPSTTPRSPVAEELGEAPAAIAALDLSLAVAANSSLPSVGPNRQTQRRRAAARRHRARHRSRRPHARRRRR